MLLEHSHSETEPGARKRRNELWVYVSRVGAFGRQDWFVYLAWVGLMLGLLFSTGGFLLLGHRAGVSYPGEAWMVPMGALVFSVSIAIDTIGHRTVYKGVIGQGEGLVHGITIFCGIGSCVLLCAAYSERGIFWVPAMVLTVLSFVYSMVDEAFHWRRYVTQASDRVEMWSHVGILVGHGIMMLGWWSWFFQGYTGVAETVTVLEALTTRS